MTADNIHSALQLTAVAMLYALGVILIFRGVHVIQGMVITPSAMILLLLGAYLVVKGIKHTWFTAEMFRASHGQATAFTSHLEIPIVLDAVLIGLASVVVFLSARPSLGRLTGPAVVASVVCLVLIGAVIPHG